MTRCLLESMSWFSPDMADMVYDQKGSWSETLRLKLSFYLVRKKKSGLWFETMFGILDGSWTWWSRTLSSGIGFHFVNKSRLRSRTLLEILDGS